MPQFSDVIDKATIAEIVQQIRNLGGPPTEDGTLPGLAALHRLTKICWNIHIVAISRKQTHGLSFFSAAGDRGLASFLGRVLPNVVHELFRRKLTDTRSGAEQIMGPLNELFQATLQLSVDFMPFDLVELERVVLLLLNGPAAAPKVPSSKTAGSLPVASADQEFSIKTVLASSNADTRELSFYSRYGCPKEVTLNKVKIVYWPDEQDLLVSRAQKLIGRRVMIEQDKETKTGEVIEFDVSRCEYVVQTSESKIRTKLNSSQSVVLPPAPKFEVPEKATPLPEEGKAVGTFLEIEAKDIPKMTGSSESTPEEDNKRFVGEVVSYSEGVYSVQLVDLQTGDLSKKVKFKSIPSGAKVVVRIVDPDEDADLAAAHADMAGNPGERTSIIRGSRPLSANSKDTPSMYLHDNVEFFASVGGFEAIHHRMRIGCDPDTPVPRVKSKKPDHRRSSKAKPNRPSVIVGVPEQKVHLGLVMVFGLIHKFSLRHLKESASRVPEITSAFTEAVFGRCLHLTQSEMRDVPTREVDLLLVLAVQLTDASARTDMIVKASQFKMKLMIMYMRCTKLERRLFGIKGLLQAVENSMEKGNEVGRNASTSMVNSAKFSVLDLPVDSKWLANFLTEQKVVDELFGSDMHLELIRRSETMILFLANRSKLTEEHLTAIWKGCVGKHEAIIEVLHTLVEELVEILPYKLRAHLFRLIAETPFEDFDERGDALKLVYNFTQKALKADKKDKSVKAKSPRASSVATISSKNVDITEFYGLEVLWRYIQDDPARIVSPDQLELALDYLVRLLAESTMCMSCRWPLIDRCLKNLKKAQSVPQSLILLRRIIKTFPQASKAKWYSADNFRSEPKHQWSIIRTLEQKYQMTKDLFDDIVMYHSCVQSAKAGDDTAWDRANGNLNEYRPPGSCYNHLEQLQHRLDFIMFAVTSSSLSLAQGSVKTIWQTLVKEAHTPESRDLVLQWFGKALLPSLVQSDDPMSPKAKGRKKSSTSKPDDNATGNFKVFSIDVMKNIFTEQMPKLKVSSMSHTAVQIYLQYFVVMNIHEHKIRITRGKQGKSMPSVPLWRNNKSSKKYSIAAGIMNLPEGARSSNGTGITLDENAPIGERSLWPTPDSIERTSRTLLGYKYLQQIALESKDNKVGSAAIKVLCNLNYRINGKVGRYEAKIQEDFFKFCLNQIKSNVGGKTNIKGRRASKLLKSFLSRYSHTEASEVKVVVLPPASGYPGSLMKRDGAPVTRASGVTLVRATTTTTVKELRAKIAYELGYIHSAHHLSLRLVNTPQLYVLAEETRSDSKRKTLRRASAGAIKPLDVAAADAAGLLDFSEKTGSVLDIQSDTKTLKDLGIYERCTLEAIDNKPVSNKSDDEGESDSEVLTPAPFSDVLDGLPRDQVGASRDQLELGYDGALSVFGSKPLSPTSAVSHWKASTEKVKEDEKEEEVDDADRASIPQTMRRKTRITITAGGKPPPKLHQIPFQEYMVRVFDKLFELLENTAVDNTTKEILWQCTLLMPQEPRVSASLSGLDSGSKNGSPKSLQQAKVDWKAVLPLDNTHRMAYGLKSMYTSLGVAAARKVKGLGKWCTSFVTSGGFVHLINAVKEASKFSGPLVGTTLAYLFHIIWIFVNSDAQARARILGVAAVKGAKIKEPKRKGSRLSIISGFRSPSSEQTMRRLSQILSGSRAKSKETQAPAEPKSVPIGLPKLAVAGVNTASAAVVNEDRSSDPFQDASLPPSPLRNIDLPIPSETVSDVDLSVLVSPILNAVTDVLTASVPRKKRGKSGIDALPLSGSQAAAGTLLRLIPDSLLMRLSLRLAVDSCLSSGTSALEGFVQHEKIGKFLRFFLLEYQDQAVREETAVGIILLTREALVHGVVDNEEAAVRTQLNKLFDLLLNVFDLLEDASNGNGDMWKQKEGKRLRKVLIQSSEQYFAVLSNMILLLGVDDEQCIAQVNVTKLYGRLGNALQNHKAVENSMSSTKDHLLIGVLQTMRAVLRVVPKLAKEPQPELVNALYEEYVFPFDSDVPKAITSESRSIVYAFLVEICEHQPENLQTLLDALDRSSLGGFDLAENSMLEEWKYSPQSELKHPNQYVGLRNLGATCYMNSLLQQIFMTPHFKEPFMKLQDNMPEDSIFHQLQVMFGALRVGNKHYYDTRAFASTLKDMDGQPLRVSEQRDVDEFASMFFDHLESESDEAKKLIQQTFSGNLVQQIVSKDPANPYVSERTEPFYVIQLDVKNKKDIRESLDTFVQGDLLAGDAQYKLPKGDKVDATKRYLIKDLPPYLFINLKRFEFNYETMNKQKLNDRCAFPLELDMEPYSYDFVASQDGSAKGEVQHHPKSHYEYELSGVLAHSGTVDSGHYYSFVRERVPKLPAVGRQWFEFNDKAVWPYPVDRIPHDCFGGFDIVERPGEGGSMVKVAVPKHYNAYILVYDRKSVVRQLNEAALVREPSVKLPAQSQEEEAMEALMEGDGVSPDPQRKGSAAGQLSRRVVDLVSQENAEFIYNKNVFDPACFKFVWNLLHMSSQETSKLPPRTRFQAIKFVTKYFLYVVCHSATKESNLEAWFDKFKQLFDQDKVACAWFLDTGIGSGGGATFAGRAYGVEEPKSDEPPQEEMTWFKMMLQDCPLANIRSLFGDLVLSCMKSLKTSDPNEYFETRLPTTGEVIPMYYNDAIPLSLVARVMDALVNLIPRASENILTCAEFFQLMLRVAELGPAERKLFMRHDLIHPLVDFYSTDRRVFTLNGKTKVVLPAELPNMTALPGLIVLLAHTCETSMNQSSPKGAPRTAVDGQVHKLSPRSRTILLEDYNWLNAIVSHEPALAAKLLGHFIWESPNDSFLLFQFLVENMTKFSNPFGADRLMSYLKVVKELMNLKDSQYVERIEACIPVIVNTVAQTLLRREEGDEKIVFYSTRMLLEACAVNSKVREAVMKHKSDWLNWPKWSAKSWATQAGEKDGLFNTTASVIGHTI